jgi:hypothetical protein
MVTLLAHDCRFDCDGTTISAFIEDVFFGSCRVADARVLEGDGGVYLGCGSFHAVLTGREFAFLLGEEVEAEPEAEPVAPVADVAPVSIPVSARVPTPRKRRTRRVAV